MPKSKPLDIRVGDSIDHAEKMLLIATLDHHNGDKLAASRDLGISRRSIYNLMRRYGLFTVTQTKVIQQ